MAQCYFYKRLKLTFLPNYLNQEHLPIFLMLKIIRIFNFNTCRGLTILLLQGSS